MWVRIVLEMYMKRVFISAVVETQLCCVPRTEVRIKTQTEHGMSNQIYGHRFSQMKYTMRRYYLETKGSSWSCNFTCVW